MMAVVGMIHKTKLHFSLHCTQTTNHLLLDIKRDAYQMNTEKLFHRFIQHDQTKFMYVSNGPDPPLLWVGNDLLEPVKQADKSMFGGFYRALPITIHQKVKGLDFFLSHAVV